MRRPDPELDAALAAAMAELADQTELGDLHYAEDGSISGRLDVPSLVAGVVQAARRARKTSSAGRAGTIYFARKGGHIKIGFSAGSPERRVGGLQTASAEPIALLGIMPGTRAVERALHERFRALHVRGEWFRAESWLLRYIERAAPALVAPVAVKRLVPRRTGSEPAVRIGAGSVRIATCLVKGQNR